MEPSSHCLHTQGLADLAERCPKYRDQGATFAKWRAVYLISTGGHNSTGLSPDGAPALELPSQLALERNARDLAEYAATCQKLVAYDFSLASVVSLVQNAMLGSDLIVACCIHLD